VGNGGEWSGLELERSGADTLEWRGSDRVVLMPEKKHGGGRINGELVRARPRRRISLIGASDGPDRSTFFTAGVGEKKR
jgi:hypothetical protein